MRASSSIRGRSSWVVSVIGGRARRVGLGLIVGTLLSLACLVATPRAATTVRVGTYTNEPRVFRDAKGVHQGVYIDILKHVGGEELDRYLAAMQRKVREGEAE
jgi:hypothetical protein